MFDERKRISSSHRWWFTTPPPTSRVLYSQGNKCIVCTESPIAALRCVTVVERVSTKQAENRHTTFHSLDSTTTVWRQRALLVSSILVPCSRNPSLTVTPLRPDKDALIEKWYGTRSFYARKNLFESVSKLAKNKNVRLNVPLLIKFTRVSLLGNYDIVNEFVTLERTSYLYISLIVDDAHWISRFANTIKRYSLYTVDAERFNVLKSN